MQTCWHSQLECCLATSCMQLAAIHHEILSRKNPTEPRIQESSLNCTVQRPVCFNCDVKYHVAQPLTIMISYSLLALGILPWCTHKILNCMLWQHITIWIDIQDSIHGSRRIQSLQDGLLLRRIWVHAPSKHMCKCWHQVSHLRCLAFHFWHHTVWIISTGPHRYLQWTIPFWRVIVHQKQAARPTMSPYYHLGTRVKFHAKGVLRVCGYCHMKVCICVRSTSQSTCTHVRFRRCSLSLCII